MRWCRTWMHRCRAEGGIDYHAKVREILSVAVRMPARTAKIDDALDRWLLHPVFGLISLAVVMFLIFQAVYAWATPLMDGIEAGFAWLGALVGSVLPEGPLASLLTDGIIAGVGGVVVFLPQILILFFFILVLEESGYLPRAAFLLDRMMAAAGLSGSSFIRCCPASPARCRASCPRAASRTRVTAWPPSWSHR